MTKAFCRFLPVIIVLYLGKCPNFLPESCTSQCYCRSLRHGSQNIADETKGFLTTFSMLARDRLTLNEMSWILIKVFFGCVICLAKIACTWLSITFRSSYLGFDVAVIVSVPWPHWRPGGFQCG